MLENPSKNPPYPRKIALEKLVKIMIIITIDEQYKFQETWL